MNFKLPLSILGLAFLAIASVQVVTVLNQASQIQSYKLACIDKYKGWTEREITRACL